MFQSLSSNNPSQSDRQRLVTEGFNPDTADTLIHSWTQQTHSYTHSHTLSHTQITREPEEDTVTMLQTLRAAV